MKPLGFLSAFPDFKDLECASVDLFRPTDISDEVLRWLAQHDVVGDDTIEWDAQGRAISDDAIIDYCWSKPVNVPNQLIIRNVGVSTEVLYNIIEVSRELRHAW